MKKRVGIWVVAAVAAAVTATAANKPTVAAGDRTFMTEVATVGMTEIELGKIAATHAASPQVKEFGQHMVADHTKANGELKALAKSKSTSLPTRITPEQRKEVDQLSKLKGHEFDKAYTAAMVKGHQTVVEKFRKQAQTAEDSDVKAFAEKMLPTLESHLEMAKTAQTDVDKATSGAGRATH